MSDQAKSSGKSENARIVKMGLIATLAMFAFGFALWPIYTIICDVTGLGGRITKTGDKADAAEVVVDESRTVKVEFVTTINSKLPWQAQPAERVMEVHPGKVYETHYVATNTAEQSLVARASYNVAPAKAGLYIAKNDCFCFTEQTLQAGQTMDMPIRFSVAADVPADVNSIIMSYTFYPVGAAVAQTVTALPGNSAVAQRQAKLSLTE